MIQTSLSSYIRRDLISIAVERVKKFIEEYKVRFLYVMYSGGKDSVAALYTSMIGARELGIPVAAMFGVVPGLTHGDNVAFVLRSWRKLCNGCPVRVLSHRRPGDTRWRVERVTKNTLFIIIGWGKYGDFWSNARIYGIPGPSERTGTGLRWCEPEHKGRWQHELPPNCINNNSPARCLVVGVRRAESSYRAKRWPHDTPITMYKTNNVPDIAISPIYDMSTADTWSIVRKTDLHKELLSLYNKWGNNPNCVLCPLRSDKLNKKAIENLLTPYLLYVKQALLQGVKRFKPSTFVYQKTMKWVKMINKELERRGKK